MEIVDISSLVILEDFSTSTLLSSDSSQKTNTSGFVGHAASCTIAPALVCHDLVRFVY
jgi:hypothetical protein